MSKKSQFQFMCEKSGINQETSDFFWSLLENQSPEDLKSHVQSVCYNLCLEAKKHGSNLKRTQAHELVSIFLGLKNRHVLAAQQDSKTNLKQQLESIIAKIDLLISKGNSNFSKTENGYDKRITNANKNAENDGQIEKLLEEAHGVSDKLRNNFINSIKPHDRKYYKICLIHQGLRNYITILTKETNPNQVLSNYFENNKVPKGMVLCQSEPIVEISKEEYENFRLELPF